MSRITIRERAGWVLSFALGLSIFMSDARAQPAGQTHPPEGLGPVLKNGAIWSMRYTGSPGEKTRKLWSRGGAIPLTKNDWHCRHTQPAVRQGVGWNQKSGSSVHKKQETVALICTHDRRSVMTAISCAEGDNLQEGNLNLTSADGRDVELVISCVYPER